MGKNVTFVTFFPASPGRGGHLCFLLLKSDKYGKITPGKEGKVRPAINFTRLVKYCLVLGVLLGLLVPGVGWAEVLKVTRSDQSLYPDPDFSSTPIAPVPVGAAVNVERQAGDWYKVDYQGKTGWIHRQAFPAPAAAGGAQFSLPGLLFGAPVKQTSSDEVALAGKGFTPEVESSYRSKHPEMNFAQVDKIESFRVAPAKLQAFIKEGDLNP
jgi:hypothetical protein